MTDHQQPREHREQAVAVCISDVRALCAELEHAIEALTGNQLEKLEAVVVAQEDLADKLHKWIQVYGPNAAEKSAIRFDSRPSEFSTLAKLIRLYSTLLKHSMRSATVRTALCKTYQATRYNRTGDIAAGDSGDWSWEV